MKFLIDNQLPLPLATYFHGRGHDGIHVLGLMLEESSDAELWTRAGREGRVLVSKDEDFVYLANRPGSSGQLVWVRLGNCRNAALAFERVFDDLVRALESGQRIVEVR
ncbi:MAG: DUF5615 family PIN-like protein [Phycisphaeraceae bacterium]